MPGMMGNIYDTATGLKVGTHTPSHTRWILETIADLLKPLMNINVLMLI